jgi:hypothetical protein
MPERLYSGMIVPPCGRQHAVTSPAGGPVMMGVIVLVPGGGRQAHISSSRARLSCLWAQV